MEAASHAHSHDPVPSRWPIITALGAGLIPVGLVTYVHGWKEGLPLLLVGLAITIFGAGSWWAELLRDRFFGREAVDAESRLRTAMIFFIADTASSAFNMASEPATTLLVSVSLEGSSSAFFRSGMARVIWSVAASSAAVRIRR